MRKMRILRQWAGVCDMTPDYSPILGPTPVDRVLPQLGVGDMGIQGRSGRRQVPRRMRRDGAHTGVDRALRARPLRSRSSMSGAGIGGHPLVPASGV